MSKYTVIDINLGDDGWWHLEACDMQGRDGYNYDFYTSRSMYQWIKDHAANQDSALNMLISATDEGWAILRGGK